MAFPASTQVLADGLIESQRIAVRLKIFAEKASVQMAAQTVSANLLTHNILQEFKSAIERWDAISALPGMDQYAKDQFDNQVLNIGAEFTAMRNAAVSVRDWIINNFPKSAGGFIEKDTLEADGSITVRNFTPAQTVDLRTELDAFVLTVA